MDDEFEFPDALAQRLGKGAINISQEFATYLSVREVSRRVHTHFEHSDFGYQQVSDDTFKLKARSRRYPLFGIFTGEVHVLEKFGTNRTVLLEGLLEFRMSILWFISVASFFFLIVYVTHPGLWLGAVFETLSTGVTIYMTYVLGRNERDDVAEHVEASCLFLRSLFKNTR